MEPLFRILKLIGCIITGGALASDSYVMFLGFGNIRQSVVTYLPITEQPQVNVCRVRRHYYRKHTRLFTGRSKLPDYITL